MGRTPLELARQDVAEEARGLVPVREEMVVVEIQVMSF